MRLETIHDGYAQFDALQYHLKSIGDYDIVDPGKHLICRRNTATFMVIGCNGLFILDGDLPTLGHYTPRDNVSEKVPRMIDDTGEQVDKMVALVMRGENDLGLDEICKREGIPTIDIHENTDFRRDIVVLPSLKQIWIYGMAQREIYHYGSF